MDQYLSTDFGGNLGVTRLKLAFESLIFFSTSNRLSDVGFGASVTYTYGILSFLPILAIVLLNLLTCNTRERNSPVYLTPTTAPYKRFQQEDTYRKYTNNINDFTTCSEVFGKKHY